MALWVTWNLGGGRQLCTGPIVPAVPGAQIEWDVHSKQGCHFFVGETRDARRSAVKCRAVFKPNEGDISFSFRLK